MTGTAAHSSTRPTYVHPVNRNEIEHATLGQRTAEQMAKVIGSWRFLIIQSVLLAAWISFNTYALVLEHWDPAPFILLNLMLSFQAAYTGPVLLIAANRSAERDRLLMEHEALEIEMQQTLLNENTELTRQIHQLTTEVHEWMRRVEGRA
ncbi:MAG TPA: DUF1003 domain-containing protein [Chloroflexota bacterium]|jgi:uncharacterized membrane protein|nr:DUF1003 domain-containing protein [Chloroflexota bacterium]